MQAKKSSWYKKESRMDEGQILILPGSLSLLAAAAFLAMRSLALGDVCHTYCSSTILKSCFTVFLHTCPVYL